MKLALLLDMAKRFLLGRTGQGGRSSVVLTALTGIFFASAFVLVSVGILAGFQQTYRKAVLDFNAHVIIRPFSFENGFTPDDQDFVQGILAELQTEFPHVNSPFLYHETLMPTRKGLRPVILKGVLPERLHDLYPFEQLALNTQAPQAPVTLIGADILDLQPDIRDSGQLRFLSFTDAAGHKAKDAAEAEGARFDTVPVTGQFRSGLFTFDSRYVIGDLESLRRRIFGHQLVDGYEIRLYDPEQIPLLYQRLNEVLPPQYGLMTWEELNRDLFEALRLERTTFFTIATLILAIACLSIFGFNFLFFLEREREFTILSMLGMPQRDLRRLLNILSLAVGALATLVAAVLAYGLLSYLYYGPGIPLDASVYFVGKVPVHFELRWFVLFILCTWGLCLATSWAAGRAVLKRHLGASHMKF